MTDWEKMFTNYISNKGLVSQRHKKHPKLNATVKKQTIQLENARKI